MQAGGLQAAGLDASSLIAQAREHAGITQVELARLAGTSQSAIAAYESGAKSPSVRTLNKVIRACGMGIAVDLVLVPAAEGGLLSEVRSHQEELRRAAVSRRIRNLRLFGSAARGDTHSESDVDFLVDFDSSKEGLLPLIGFAREAETILGRSVDISSVDMLAEKVRVQALAEAVPL